MVNYVVSFIKITFNAAFRYQKWISDNMKHISYNFLVCEINDLKIAQIYISSIIGKLANSLQLKVSQCKY